MRFLDLCVKEASRSVATNPRVKSKYNARLPSCSIVLTPDNRSKMMQRKHAEAVKAEIRSKYTFTGESSDKPRKEALKSRSGGQQGGIRGMEI
jgi:hypothetical protein